MQEQTIRQTDLNRLCLLLRIQIKECYQNARKRAPEIRIRHNKVEISGVGTYDPVVLCRRLKWNLPEWHGTPMEELMDLRLKKEQEAGSLVLGELALPGLTAEEQSEGRMLQANKENWTEVVKKKKRPSQDSRDDNGATKKYKKADMASTSRA
ncbi:unnamed protein product [Cylicostephanus goldi]|uniref:Uncharacterized protein n=1 Tax=Cylicostephanus goldi TaxID=71465 RepID=A0A3P6RHK7_CYLGO|nr:unnamed protein product [Cylicostephanus goldi]